MAFNLELLNQAILNKEPEIKKNYWINFSENLSKLKKNYKEVDAEFITGLDNFCEGIRDGYAVTSNSSNGYSLSCNWVLNLFIGTFDPILIKSYPTNTNVWTELALASIPLPLKQHFSEKSRFEIADKLDGTKNELEEAALKGNRIDNLLIKEAATIGLLANILFYLNNMLPSDEIEWCEKCFRRAPKNSKHCKTHRPLMEGSNNQFKVGNKIIKNVANDNPIEYFTFIEKCKKIRSIRALFDNEIFFSKEEFNENTCNCSYIPVDEEVYLLIKETTNGYWPEAAIIWEPFIQSSLPFVDKILKEKPCSCASWVDFLESARLSLQENIERCKHPYWFILELAMANAWLDIESKYLATNQTELKIINLANDGLKTQEIMAILGLGKSRVYQVINEAKKSGSIPRK